MGPDHFHLLRRVRHCNHVKDFDWAKLLVSSSTNQLEGGGETSPNPRWCCQRQCPQLARSPPSFWHSPSLRAAFPDQALFPAVSQVGRESCWPRFPSSRTPMGSRTPAAEHASGIPPATRQQCVDHRCPRDKASAVTQLGLCAQASPEDTNVTTTLGAQASGVST